MDNYNNYLTSSAEEALECAVNEFRKKILSEAYEIAIQNNTAKEIALGDIQEAKRQLMGDGIVGDYSKQGLSSINKAYEDTKTLQPRKSFNLKYERLISIATLILLASLLYLFLGIVAYLYLNFHSLLREDIGLMFIGTGLFGIFLAGFIYLFSRYLRRVLTIRREVRRMREQNELIDELWLQIEECGYKLKSKERSETDSSVTSVIDYLSEVLKYQGDDLKLKHILQVRNILIHKDPAYISEDEKNETILKAKYILNLLEQKIGKDIDPVSSSH